jgi:hypothetical protein
MEDDDGGLFNIELSSSDESVDVKEKVPRDFQSEDDFERQRKEWKPKIEAGEVGRVFSTMFSRLESANDDFWFKLWKTLKLPMDNPSKQESQAILHAIEEMYFFKRYEKAKRLAEEALKGNLIEEFRKSVEDYRRRCEMKLESGEA